MTQNAFIVSFWFFGHVNVGDRFWRSFMLVTCLRCWWQIPDSVLKMSLISSWFLWYFEFRWCLCPDWPVPSISTGSKLDRPIGSHEIVLVHRILLRRSVYASIIGSYQLNWYKLFLAIFVQFRFNKWFWLVDWDLRIGTWCVFDSRYLK